jgi:endonuclease YncB( thermonuclease family)
VRRMRKTVLLLASVAVAMLLANLYGCGSGQNVGTKNNEGLSKEEEKKLNQRLQELEKKVGAGDKAQPELPEQQTEDDVRAAAEAYYQAVSDGDWSYTYNNLDSETQSHYTEEEWFAKNQWFADNGSVGFDILSVNLDNSAPEPIADVSVGLNYGDGTSSTRLTYFVYEDGSWKHRFGEEENNLYMADASYEEFVAAQGGPSSASSSASPSADAKNSAQPVGAGSENAEGSQATVRVERAVDGDTIEISPTVDGEDTVRLIGIDAPESKEPGCGLQPLAKDAAEEAALWEYLKVELEFDEERTDRYGRLLAYVHDPLTDEMMNAEMLRSGYAQLWIIPPNTKHEDELRAAQQEAKTGSLGHGLDIWSLPPAKDAQLADHGNGIGKGDGACPPEEQAQQNAASSSASPNPSPNRNHNAPNLNAPNPTALASASSSASPAAGSDIDCSQVDGPVWVGANDPNNLDGNDDGWGCE